MATNRSVKVSLVSEVNGFISGMDAAAKKTRELGSESEKLAQKRDAINTLGVGLTAIGAIAATGVGLAVTKFAEFDSAMSSVQAATHESEANMTLLRDAAIDAGQSTVFSATESANAIEELSKAGLSTADVLGGGLKGSLDLASAGGLGVARAAEIASTTLQQFKLDGSDAAHVADVLAAGAGKAMGSVDDLANGLKFVGPVAQSLGISLEETTGTLALFAQAGIVGEQGGTSLRGVLSSLTAPSNAASKEIERLGLNLYDANGKFLGLSNAAGQLGGAYQGMDDKSRSASLGIIFGRETITAATALYQAGAEGVDQWTTAVDDSGFASETARLKLDNLKGDVEALGGTLETALIQTGSGANDALRFLTQAATDSVQGFNNLDPAVQATTLGLGTAVAAVGTAGGAFLLAVPKVAEFRTAIDQMGPGAQKAGAAVVGLGKGLAVLGGALAAAQVLDKLTASSENAAKGVDETTSALLRAGDEDLFEGLGTGVDSFADGLELLTGDSFNSQMNRFGSTLNGIFAGGSLSDVVLETKDQFDTIGQSLGQLVSGGDAERAAELFDELATKAQAEGVSRKELLELMPAYQDALAGVNNEQVLAADSAGTTTDALGELAGQAESAEGEVSDLAEAIANFGAAQFDVNSTTRDFEAAIDDATAALEKNGQTLDIGSEAGRANQDALDGIASSALSMSAAIITQTNDQEAASAAIQRGRDAYIAASVAAGVSEEAANAYADQLGLIPSNVTTAIGATGVTKTQADIDAIQANLAETVRNLQINIRAAVDRSQLDSLLASIRTARSEMTDLNGAASGNGRMGTYATGGAVYGPGSGTSDDVPAWLSNGEHILTAQDVSRMGGQAAVYAFREGLTDGRSKYARGGAVSRTVYSTAVATSPSVTVMPAKVVLDMPVYTDGSLLGYVRGIAGQEVQFALATEEQRMNQRWRQP